MAVEDADVMIVMKPFKGMSPQNTALVVIDIMNSCVAVECETPEWNIHFSKIRESIIAFVESFVV